MPGQIAGVARAGSDAAVSPSRPALRTAAKRLRGDGLPRSATWASARSAPSAIAPPASASARTREAPARTRAGGTPGTGERNSAAGRRPRSAAVRGSSRTSAAKPSPSAGPDPSRSTSAAARGAAELRGQRRLEARRVSGHGSGQGAGSCPRVRHQPEAHLRGDHMRGHVELAGARPARHQEPRPAAPARRPPGCRSRPTLRRPAARSGRARRSAAPRSRSRRRRRCRRGTGAPEPVPLNTRSPGASSPDGTGRAIDHSDGGRRPAGQRDAGRPVGVADQPRAVEAALRAALAAPHVGPADLGGRGGDDRRPPGQPVQVDRPEPVRPAATR